MYHRKVWYQANPELYQCLKAEIAHAYPDLHFSVRAGLVFLSGSFPISNGPQVVDRFRIEIEFPPHYPRGIPVVYEIDGRIPRILDRHVYDNGECCLYFLLQVAEVVPEGSGFLDFLNGPVRSFFVSQSYFELTGKWPFDTWPHGPEALIEYYGAILGISDPGKIRNFFQTVSKKEIKGHWACPCGSGKRLRNCHFDIVKKLHQDYQYALQQTKWHERGKNADKAVGTAS